MHTNAMPINNIGISERENRKMNYLPGIMETIIQNANPLTAYKTIIEKADGFVKNSAYSSIVTLIACYGWNAFRNMIDIQFERLQRSQLPVNQYRWKALMCKMFQAFDYLNPTKPEKLVKTQYGTLALGE